MDMILTLRQFSTKFSTEKVRAEAIALADKMEAVVKALSEKCNRENIVELNALYARSTRLMGYTSSST